MLTSNVMGPTLLALVIFGLIAVIFTKTMAARVLIAYGIGAALSAIAQSVGYVLAALGPVAIGLIHQVSGGWTVPLLAGIGVCLLQLAAGVLAGRPRPATA